MAADDAATRSPNAEAQDAEAQDAGAQDAGSQDAESQDAEPQGSGDHDTGAQDTGASEGSTSDAGAVDAGAVDAGSAGETSSASSGRSAKGAPSSKPAAVEAEAPADEIAMDWYILKVASNREDSIRAGLIRRAKIAGLEHNFGEIIVPTETITEYKNGKRRTKKQKLWPGYLVVQMILNDDTWFLVRETPGIGDFTGSADRASGERPAPMLADEVQKILAKCRPAPRPGEGEAPRPVIAFRVGERVKINDGTFQNFEGEVEAVDQTNGRVTVMINIFGRSTPVELEGWQIESL